MYETLTSILSSFVALIPITLSQSLILSFVVLGIMLPFRILSFPDLTSEGAYPFGGCVCAVLMASGVPPLFAILLAMACGFAAGCSTAFFHLRFHINTLLSGILVLTMLYSINLRVMGRSNISILGVDTVYGWISSQNPNAPPVKIMLVGILAIIIIVLMKLFFATEKGVAVRAVGANAEMSEAQGISVWRATILGVGLRYQICNHQSHR